MLVGVCLVLAWVGGADGSAIGAKPNAAPLYEAYNELHALSQSLVHARWILPPLSLWAVKQTASLHWSRR